MVEGGGWGADTARVTPTLPRLRRPLILFAATVLMLTSCAAADPTTPTGPEPAAAADAHTRLQAAPTGGDGIPDGTATPPETGGSAAADARPNIVFITTDDQRTDEMRWMPYTRDLLGGHGVTFPNGLSPHPLCCPARAEWVTGQYGHNNGVHHNKGAWGGFEALKRPEDTLAAWLSKAGYRTAMAGKYLNGYKAEDGKQVGWTHWNASVRGVYSYFRTEFFNDGRPVLHAGEHVDDVVAGYAKDYIREFAATDEPFFVWASNLSPHDEVHKGHPSTPPPPAVRHENLFAGTVPTSLAKPSYGVETRGWRDPAFEISRGGSTVERHLARIRSLQAVDEQVREIVSTLREVGELDNTYIVFTSDNGFLLGEHNVLGKNMLYDEALRVPVLVRVPESAGPGAAGARVSQAAVTLVDMAPTFLDIAQVTAAGRRMDGTSFRSLLDGRPQTWRDTQLVQTGRIAKASVKARDAWGLRGVRTDRYTYAVEVATGAEVLFDRVHDRYERTNLAAKKSYRRVLRDLRKRYKVLSECAGTACDASFGAVPAPKKHAEKSGKHRGGKGR